MNQKCPCQNQFYLEFWIIRIWRKFEDRWLHKHCWGLGQKTTADMALTANYLFQHNSYTLIKSHNNTRLTMLIILIICWSQCRHVWGLDGKLLGCNIILGHQPLFHRTTLIIGCLDFFTIPNHFPDNQPPQCWIFTYRQGNCEWVCCFSSFSFFSDMQ